MDLPRKSLSSLMLVGALFGTPALASIQASETPGAVGHPPVLQLATLPQRLRVRRRIRGATLRAIAWRIGCRVRGAAARIRAGRENVQPRLPPHDSYARGPPRSPGG